MTTVETLASDPSNLPQWPEPRFDFLHVNGFIYRCNKMTGEMWRLEAHASEKKTQVWKKIEDLTSVIQ